MKKSYNVFALLLVLFSWFAYGNVGQVSFDLKVPIKSKNKSITMLIPIPINLVSSQSTVGLTSDKKPLSAVYSILNTWPSAEDTKYIRLLHVELVNTQKTLTQLTLHWGNESNISNNRRKTNINSFLKGSVDTQNMRLVYPSSNWLARSVLLHPKSEYSEDDWYLKPQEKYANYVTNVALLTQNGYPPEKASQWLYDRPQAIYQLFIMTGDEKWLIKAREISQFYANSIDDDGESNLIKRFDPKFMMPKGLLYQYLLSGDLKAKNTLVKLYESSLKWDESYNIGRGFWTERNQGAALNTAISYWELTSEPKALERINNIIDATIKMTFYPENDWSLRGCPQHGFKSHEGRGDDSPTCSPWMMALLGDALWRFYQLTGDKRASSLIDAFGDFILNYGIFYGDKRVKNIVIPKYIVSIENPEQEELNQWSSPQHACDVAALLGKSAYIKQQSNQDDFLVKALFRSLLEQCKQPYGRLKKAHKKKQVKNYWSLKPPRRFGWMYSSTSDLPWLNSLLLNNY
jgi:hypothetical protein